MLRNRWRIKPASSLDAIFARLIPLVSNGRYIAQKLRGSLGFSVPERTPANVNGRVGAARRCAKQTVVEIRIPPQNWRSISELSIRRTDEEQLPPKPASAALSSPSRAALQCYSSWRCERVTC